MTLLQSFYGKNLPAVRVEPDGRQYLIETRGESLPAVSPSSLSAYPYLSDRDNSLKCANFGNKVERKALFPGAFNPLHDGHLQLAQVAAQLLYTPVVFEVCICNVDKPTLTLEQVIARLRQFAWRYPVWITRAATFVDKARLFPDTIFVVGADTAERILAARYYSAGETGLREALEIIRCQGCSFLVGRRRNSQGQLMGRDDLVVLPAFHDLFQEIPAEKFQKDISSTQLRQQLRSDGNGGEGKNY